MLAPEIGGNFFDGDELGLWCAADGVWLPSRPNPLDPTASFIKLVIASSACSATTGWEIIVTAFSGDLWKVLLLLRLLSSRHFVDAKHEAFASSIHFNRIALVSLHC